MILRLSVALCLASATASGHAQTTAPVQPAAPEPVVARIRVAQGKDWAPLRYETVRGVILIPVVVNGHAITALLDNGTDHTVIDSDFAERNAIVLGASTADAVTGSAARMASRKAPGVTFEVPHAITVTGEIFAIDLSQVSAALGRPVDAILGDDVLEKLATMIDPDKMELSLVRSGAITPASNAVVLPMDSNDRVTATINGVAVRLQVDLGFNGVARITDAAWQRVFPAGTAVEANSQTTAAGIERNTRRAMGNLSLGGIGVTGKWIDSGFVSTWSDGLLGNEVMSRFVTIIEGPKRQLILIPRATKAP